jgi:hypothetical protein
MHRKSLLAGFVAGAATVVGALMILSSAGRTVPRAMAQTAQPRVERPGGEAPPQETSPRVLVNVVKSEVGQGQPQGTGVTGAGPAVPAAASPRYQISAWAQSGGGGGGAHGAFVIDMQNGRIWELDIPQGNLRPVGQVRPE